MCFDRKEKYVSAIYNSQMRNFSHNSIRHSEKQLNQHEVKVVNAIPYVVPSDSMDAPLVIPIDENRLKKTLASQVQTQATDTQIHPPGTPQIVVAGNHS